MAVLSEYKWKAFFVISRLEPPLLFLLFTFRGIIMRTVCWKIFVCLPPRSAERELINVLKSSATFQIDIFDNFQHLTLKRGNFIDLKAPV